MTSPAGQGTAGAEAASPPPRPSPASGGGRAAAKTAAALPPPQAGEGRGGGNAADIRAGDWVERWLPRAVQPYARLARLDRPIGTWLLLFPGWWAIALAAPGWPDARLMLLFGVGAVAMRGAGCTLNDIIDRDFDARVARTRTRPLPSGAVTLWQAGLFLVLQLAIGAAVLASLTPLAIRLGFLVLLLVATYPL